MNPHPTPFPGKGRPALNPAAKKEKNRPKSTEAVPKSNKPKRTFGAVLSNNIPVERASQKPAAAKPWKPSGVSRNPPKPMNKVSAVSSGAQGRKSASDKKPKHLTSQGWGSPAAISQNDLLCTPVKPTKPLAQDTPFLSAENCSKCRLDKLETSSYWLAQIRLAESAGKHLVSAAFFRLSLECKAQPFVALRNELQHYQSRHGFAFSEKLWSDLCRDYGLPSGELRPDSSDVDNIDGVVVEQDDCNKPEEILDNMDAVKDVSEEIRSVSNFDLQDDKKSISSSNLNEDVNDALKIAGNVSNFDLLSLNDSASERKSSKPNHSDRCCEQAGTISGRKSAGRKDAGAATIRLRDRLKSTRKSRELSSVVNREEAEGIQIALQDAEP
ncbi:hypothetical protein AXF42_Ash012263 [Apostasia shenzhenica]|uniref:Uncharacterized protein n=1 Tax=Apostasia shenzhenica TaxID=1088818 RepID=A0A2I0B4F1_9ASPA|nr:hypothetical protein AXF42_Ash012263 [Apostasia shenzhenica]